MLASYVYRLRYSQAMGLLQSLNLNSIGRDNASKRTEYRVIRFPKDTEYTARKTYRGQNQLFSNVQETQPIRTPALMMKTSKNNRNVISP